MGKPPPSLLHPMKPLPSSPQVHLRALLLNKPKLSLPDMLSLEPLSKPLMLPPEMLRPLEEKPLVLSRLLKVAFKLLTRVKLVGDLGLVETLKGVEAATIFAPSDEAFAKL